jgi:hypothetical protein
MDFDGLPPIPTSSFFPSFWVPDFQGHFEALNNVFKALHRKNVYSLYRTFQWDIVRIKQRSYGKFMTSRI